MNSSQRSNRARSAAARRRRQPGRGMGVDQVQDHRRRFGQHRAVRQHQRRQLAHRVQAEIVGIAMLAGLVVDADPLAGRAGQAQHDVGGEGAGVLVPVQPVHRRALPRFRTAATMMARNRPGSTPCVPRLAALQRLGCPLRFRCYCAARFAGGLRRRALTQDGRSMNIHEYQAKGLLGRYGVPVPRGGVAYTPEEAVRVAEGLGGAVYVVKAQIHAGGRGKGHFKEEPQGKGGVRVVKSTADVAAAAEAMLGRTLVTVQTGPAGKEVGRIYVEEGCDIAPRAVSVAAGRPQERPGDDHRLDRGRHGDRGGRRGDAGEDPDHRHRPGDRPVRLPRPQGRLRPRAWRASRSMRRSASSRRCTRPSTISTPRWWRSTRWW